MAFHTAPEWMLVVVDESVGAASGTAKNSLVSLAVDCLHTAVISGLFWL